jgi:hypothetical protein
MTPGTCLGRREASFNKWVLIMNRKLSNGGQQNVNIESLTIAGFRRKSYPLIHIKSSDEKDADIIDAPAAK